MTSPESGVSIGFANKKSEEIWKRGEKKHEEWIQRRREQLKETKAHIQEEGKEPFNLERFSKVYLPPLPGIKIMKSTPEDIEEYEMEYYLDKSEFKTIEEFAKDRMETDVYIT